ncbi:hypothetical protein F5887DRAFT_916694 [Amanita rubescens]|nr:hypothetical protein F5887DRAFT_916694 [Amanita rubescens]
MASSSRRPLDRRLEDVINRYEAQISRAQDVIESALENIVQNDWIARLAEYVMRMPREEDTGLWRVRVRAMLKDRAEEESVILLQDRLKVRPQWANGVFLPPGGKRWICIRSNSRENVEKLCLHLSTFPHPLEIIFLPVEERWEWLMYCNQVPRITPPAWMRIKRKSELTRLLSNGCNVDKRNETSVIVCLVPRSPVPISNGESREDPANSTAEKKHGIKHGPAAGATRVTSLTIYYPSHTAISGQNFVVSRSIAKSSSYTRQRAFLSSHSVFPITGVNVGNPLVVWGSERQNVSFAPGVVAGKEGMRETQSINQRSSASGDVISCCAWGARRGRCGWASEFQELLTKGSHIGISFNIIIAIAHNKN